MTRPLIAMFACYALGLVAGRQQIHCVEAQRSVSTEPAVQQDSKRSPVVAPVIKTPLVEALRLPPKSLEKPSETRKSAVLTTTPVDGQLSKGGNFRYESARNIWVPVDKGNRRYTHNGRPVTAAHLIATHGHHPSSANKWTQAELDIAHANDHAAEVAATRTDGYFAPTNESLPLGGKGYRWTTSQSQPTSDGHWEVRKVCSRNGCNYVRVWVQD